MAEGRRRQSVHTTKQRLLMWFPLWGLFLFAPALGLSVACLSPFSSGYNAAFIVVATVVYLVVAVKKSLRVYRQPAGQEREFVDEGSGFRGEFEGRLSGYHRLEIGMVVFFVSLFVVMLALLPFRATEPKMVKLIAVIGGGSLLWTGWLLARYRGWVRRYRVGDDDTLEVFGRGAWESVDLSRYGKVIAVAGSTSNEGYGLHYCKHVLLRAPRDGAPVLTFGGRGTYSVELGTRVEGGFVFQYFFDRCRDAGFHIKDGAYGGGWVARNIPPEAHPSASYDPDVFVRGEFLRVDGSRQWIEMTLPAANLDDDEIWDLVESLQQGEHPGGRWLNTAAIEIRRAGKTGAG